MSPVIRSTRFNDEPLLLERARKQDIVEAHVVPPQEAFQPEGVPEETLAVQESVLDPIIDTEVSIESPLSEDAQEAVAVPEEVPVVMTPEDHEARMREELEAQRAQAREEGYAEGLAEGRREGEAEFVERLRLADELFVSARDAIEKHLDGMTDVAVEITFEAITRILGDRFIDKSGTEAIVREIIRQSKERSKLVVRVAPADYEALSKRRAELADGLNVSPIELVADDLVELGGCVLETPSGSLDARLEIQVQRLRETLLNARLKWNEHGD